MQLLVCQQIRKTDLYRFTLYTDALSYNLNK